MQTANSEFEMENQRIVRPKIPELRFNVREAINALRGNIQLSGYNVKVVAVTSALAHEGKSSTAFRLAKSLAGLNKRTLYMDCDIRNSMVKERYKITSRTVGLSEFLCGKIGINGIVYRTEDPWMDIIFTGAVAPNPSELLSGPLFEQLLTQLKRHYEYVVVDTPPVNLVIDGALVAKQCDGTVLVVESGVTERAQVIRAKQQLEFAGVKLLGVVLNKVETRKGAYGRKYGYGYGSEYGYGEDKKSKKKGK